MSARTPGQHLHRYQGTNFITGMRAWAAFAVFLGHTGGGGMRDWGAFFSHLVDMGRFGVYVFFVIAGFSVTASYVQNPDLRSYLVQRFMRIAPLYWCVVVIVYAAHHGAGWSVPAESWRAYFSVPLDGYNFLMHISFLGFLDYRITNSVIGVEWTLPIEVFYYVLIPLVLSCILTARKHKRYLQGAVLCAVYLVIAWGGCILLRVPLRVPEDGSIAELWQPMTHLVPFALGVAAFYVRPWLDRCRGWSCWIILLAGLLVVLAEWLLKKEDIIFQVMAFILIVFLGDKQKSVKILLNNKYILWGGTISYSFYLLHLPVIHWLPQNFLVTGEGPRFWMVFAVTLAVSSLTYRIIESPTRQWGRNLSLRLATRNPAMA